VTTSLRRTPCNKRITFLLYGLPERGVYPKELLDLGIRDYREVFFKPCRIIYRLQGEREAEIDDNT